MTDVNQWSSTDASNNGASPTGWASATMLPSQVEPTARAMMGGTKRLRDQLGPAVTSAGTANVQTLTYSPAHGAYVAGDIFTFIVGALLTNSGSATLNVNTLGAKTIKRNGANLVAGELVAGNVVSVGYDGANMQLLGGAATIGTGTVMCAISPTTTGTLTTAAISSTSGGIASDGGAAAQAAINLNRSGGTKGSFYLNVSSDNPVLWAGADAITMTNPTGVLKFNQYGAGTLYTDASGNVSAAGANTVAAAGTVKLASGVIMKWGSAVVSGSTAITFDSVFPNAVYSVVVTGQAGLFYNVSAPLVGGFTCVPNAAGSATVNYIAIGS